MTMAMTRCGTPYWTAPEIITGQRYNESVDQYAYGMSLLEILTGKTPWQADTAAGTMAGNGRPIAKQLNPMKVRAHKLRQHTRARLLA
eukprot:COSAG01_NODE_21823_length_883_cov_1.285714_1_plen_87_part_10